MSANQQYDYDEVDEEELQKDHEATGSKRPKTMPLEEGNNTLRFLPPRKGQTSIGTKFYVHEWGQDATYRSWLCEGDGDPGCAWAEKLKLQPSQADQDAYYRLKRKLEVYLDVINMAHKEAGTQVLRLKENQYHDLIGLSVDDPKSGEPGCKFWKVETGRNVIIERVGSGKKTRYKIRIGNAPPISLDTPAKGMTMDWLNQRKVHSEYVRAMPAERVRAMLEGADEEEDENGYTPPKRLNKAGDVSAPKGPGTIADDPDLQ